MDKGIFYALGFMVAGGLLTTGFFKVETAHRRFVCEQFPVLQMEKIRSCAEFTFE
jgi:hypothetical protein